MTIKTFLTNNYIKINIPTSINLLDNYDITINKILEGFLIKRASIDSNKIFKFPKNRQLILCNIFGEVYPNQEYNIEIEDEDTLKLIRI